MIDITIGVLEDALPADLVADLDLGRAWAPPAMLTWWQDLLGELQAQPRFRAPKLNPEFVAQGLARDSARIEVLLCSRASFDTLTECEDALGAHLISTPDSDPFNEEAAFARAYRVLVVSDREEFITRIRELTCEDDEPEHYLDGYIEAYAATVFHEIAHALIFAENAALLPPSEIDLLSDAGEIGHDVFDCSTCYGIRPLDIDGTEVWADTVEEAQEMIEIHVEDMARQMGLALLRGPFAPAALIAAMGVSRAELLPD